MEIETFVPIIIPTLNRYEHFKKCVETLSQCKYADKTELVIGLDYPPAERYVDGWKRIKEYLPTISGFKKVVVFEERENIGAAKNASKLRQYVKEQGHKAFISTEDDNVFSPNFIEYMNWGLCTFKDDNRILAVCGFKRVDTSFLQNNIYIYPQFVAWGFGMWFDRREKLDQWTDFSKLKDFVKKCPITIVFSQQIFKIVGVIRMIKNQYILGDYLPFFLPKEERYCLYPAISKVRNEGFDGSGLHCGNSLEQSNMYLNLPIDDNKDFIPQIKESLYNPKLKIAYDNVYKRPFNLKKQIIASVTFLVYKFTGKYWRI